MFSKKEFGTNRPTPFTALDDDDDDGDEEEGNRDIGDVEVNAHKNTSHHYNSPDKLPRGYALELRSKTGREKSKAGGSHVNSKTQQSTTAPSSSANTGEENFNAPTRFFTEDATDLIGRFLFGNLPVSDDTTVTATTQATSSTKIGGGGKTGKKGIPTSASFGSASSISSLASGGTTTSLGGKSVRRSRVAAVNLGGGTKRQSSSVNNADDFTRDAHSTGNENDDLDYGPGWDEDEISLWSASKSNIYGYAEDAGMRTIGSKNRTEANKSSTKDGFAVQDSMPSRKRDLEVSNHMDSTCERPLVVVDDVAYDHSTTRRKNLYAQRNKFKRRNWDQFGKAARDASEFDQNKLALNKSSSETFHSLTNFHNQRDMTSNTPAEYAYDSNMKQMSIFPKIPSSTPTTVVYKNDKIVTKKTHDTSIKEDIQKPSDGKESQRAIIVDDGTQHWMPDNLCKHCYSCEAPFTLIRRKHHCRLCGMIFCSTCSAYFVKITLQAPNSVSLPSKGDYGTMRTCKMCYDHISERGLGVVMRGATVQTNVGYGEISKKSVSTQNLEPNVDCEGSFALEEGNDVSLSRTAFSNITRDIVLPKAKSPPDSKTKIEEVVRQTPSTSSEIIEQLAGFRSSEDVSDDFHALSMTRHMLNEKWLKREEQERVERAEKMTETNLVSTTSTSASQPAGLQTRLGGLAKPAVRQLRWKSSSNLVSKAMNPNHRQSPEMIEANPEAVEVRVGDCDVNANLLSQTGSKLVQASKDVVIPDEDKKVESAIRISESHTGMEEVLSGQQQNKDAASSAKRHIGTVAAKYLEKLGRELLQTDAPLLLNEIRETSEGSALVGSQLTDVWINTLMTLATRCCATVEPDVKNKGDLLDIRPYW